MNAREFHHGNTIPHGSQPNNPWISMLEQDLNFRREEMDNGLVGFSNRNPRPGEERLYSITQSASMNSGQGLASVAYFSNGARGFVLLVNGVNMVTAEAAGEFVTDPARLPHMEILLRTTDVDHTVHTASVIATRRLDWSRRMPVLRMQR